MNIKLKDGRILGYAEYGDPQGTPGFLFHGTPGSRYFCPSDEITRKLKVRLICPERPGYGESTFHPNRRILDWADDVVQLADHLGIDRFGVAGHSGGGPYALACAKVLSERVTAVGIISGAGPVDAPRATEGMSINNWFGFKFGRYVPWSLGRVLLWWLYHERSADPAVVMDRETGHRPHADDELIAKAEIREVCVRSEVEAYRPGMIGFAWDVRLITRPWGFQLSDIYIPVFIWHGSEDNSTSIPMARHMADEIQNAKLNILDGEAHLLIFQHWEEILSTLVDH